jgi:DNA-binding NarL/FixJ family response regulator
MKFVLVEDQVMFRGLIRKLLVEECRGKILLETTTLAELRANLDKVRQADVLLLDIRLPDGDGLDFVDEMSAAHVATPVLLFSSSCEDYIVHRVGRTFAQGFVHKDEEAKVLLTAIQMVAAGGAFFSPRFVERRRQLEKSPGNFAKLLSPREQELLRYIGARARRERGHRANAPPQHHDETRRAQRAGSASLRAEGGLHDRGAAALSARSGTGPCTLSASSCAAVC